MILRIKKNAKEPPVFYRRLSYVREFSRYNFSPFFFIA